MIDFVFAFLVGGLICMIAQLIMNKFKLLPIHMTVMFVSIGACLEAFNLYDKLIEIGGAGALLPISSFGHSLTDAALSKAQEIGYFGIFQGVMPILGFLLGGTFAETIEKYDHWVAFILLGMIGINMIREAFDKDEEVNDKVDFKSMIWLAIATSIDALTVGITFSFLKVNIWFVSLLIAMVTYVLSVLGVLIGNKFGCKYKAKAEVAGGIILLSMGVKIVLEHLTII